MYSGRRLFRKFSGVPGFDGWMIARLDIVCFLGQENTEAGSEVDGLHKQQKIVEDSGKKGGAAIVIKHKKSFALLEASDQVLKMKLYLLKPVNQSDRKLADRRIGGGRNLRREEEDFHKIATSEHWSPVGTICFTNKVIQDFVFAVGDSNPIHRTESPVVPGFLVLEYLLERGYLEKLLLEKGGCRITFQEPLYAEEEMELYQNRESGKICVFTGEDGLHIIVQGLAV